MLLPEARYIEGFKNTHNKSIVETEIIFSFFVNCVYTIFSFLQFQLADFTCVQLI